MIVKENTRACVVWELADGLHTVRAADEVLVQTGVETLARMTYDDAVEARDPAKRWREAERAEFDFQRARWDGFGVRSTKNKGKGGRGGRGGV